MPECKGEILYIPGLNMRNFILTWQAFALFHTFQPTKKARP